MSSRRRSAIVPACCRPADELVELDGVLREAARNDCTDVPPLARGRRVCVGHGRQHTHTTLGARTIDMRVAAVLDERTKVLAAGIDGDVALADDKQILRAIIEDLVGDHARAA